MPEYEGSSAGWSIRLHPSVDLRVFRTLMARNLIENIRKPARAENECLTQSNPCPSTH